MNTYSRRKLIRSAILSAAASAAPAYVKSSEAELKPYKWYTDISQYTEVVLPREHGQLTSTNQYIHRRYPSREHCMQLAAFFNKNSGVLIIANDSTGGISDWTITPGKTLTIEFFGSQPDVLVLPIERSLEQIAGKYKEWAYKQFWIKNRSRSSTDLKFISVAAGSSIEVDRSNLKNISSLIPEKKGVWFTLWRDAPFDQMYPDYTPKENVEFRRLLRDIKRSGNVAFPYINGLTWDINYLNFQSRGKEVGLVDAKSNFVPYKNTMNHLLYACPYSSIWQDQLILARSNLVDLDGDITSGVYLDMLGATSPFICSAGHHEHEPNDPFSWIRGIRKLLSGIDGYIFIEGCAEVYLDLVDYPLMHFHTNKSDSIPLWKYVYGDLIPARGWRVPKSTTSNQFTDIMKEIKYFSVIGKGSPWITTEHERELFKRRFHEIAFSNK